jgi:hypothetical protein
MTLTRKTIAALLAVAILVCVVIAGIRPTATRSATTYSPAVRTTTSSLASTFTDDGRLTVTVGSSDAVVVAISASTTAYSVLTISIDGTIPRHQGRHLIFALEGQGGFLSGSAVLHIPSGRHVFALVYFSGSASSATYWNRSLTVAPV